MMELQLILNPIRDWNKSVAADGRADVPLQLILNPIRDWNFSEIWAPIAQFSSN